MTSLFSRFVAGAVALASVAAAYAGDHNPPPWRGLPLTTVQGWGFSNSPTGGINPFPDPTVAPLNNPYTWPGAPATGPVILGGQGASWTPATPAGVPGVFIGPGGFMDFFIPNNFDPFTIKECWIQIKFSGALPAVSGQGFNPNGTLMSPGFPPPGGGITGPFPGPIPNMFEMTIRMQFDGNPAWEIIRIFNPSTFEPLFIYQVVIDTICPTPGTAAAGLLGVGLLASRRRR